MAGVFLELGSAVIHEDALHLMTQTRNTRENQDAWMRDEALDMALEILSRQMQCPRYGIEIISSTYAQICHLAYQCGDGAATHYDQYRDQLLGRRWIFIPMNNGIGGEEDGGSHWSLIIVDRERRCVYYYDSLFKNNFAQQALAKEITLGLFAILREGDEELWFSYELRAPDQDLHNLFHGDSGPCAPFVYKMCSEMIRHIIDHDSPGRVEACLLHLAEGFPEYFATIFNSLDVRREMQRSIVEWRRNEDREAEERTQADGGS